MDEPNYNVPMAGQCPINWNLGMNEDGEIEGFIGIPRNGKAAQPKGIGVENLGCTIGFGRTIQGFSPEELMIAVDMAWTHAMESYVVPQLLKERQRLLAACLEMQVRKGGYLPPDDEPKDTVSV